MRISDGSSDVCSSDLAGLADHVLVEDFQDLPRLGQRAARRLGLLLELLADDVVAQLHAFIADEHARARNQLAHLMLALPAKRAIQDLAAVAGKALSVFEIGRANVCTPVTNANLVCRLLLVKKTEITQKYNKK